jgi:hypothetical protein
MGARPICQYFPTSDNAVAQLAVAFYLIPLNDPSDFVEQVVVLQEHACIQCTRDQAEQWKKDDMAIIIILSGERIMS